MNIINFKSCFLLYTLIKIYFMFDKKVWFIELKKNNKKLSINFHLSWNKKYPIEWTQMEIYSYFENFIISSGVYNVHNIDLQFHSSNSYTIPFIKLKNFVRLSA